MRRSGAYLIAVISTCLFESLPAWGQQVIVPLARPPWLAPFPQARDQSVNSNSMQATAAYTAPAGAADVIAHYEREMKAAGIDFRTQNDGLGVSIVAAAGNLSAVVSVREEQGVSMVRVSYAATPDLPAPAPTQAAMQPAPPALRPQTVPKRAPVSPYAHEPYTWVMQSNIIARSNPPRYTAFYYEAPTDASIERPLALPSGGTIVDAFPQDCGFTFRDEAGRSYSYKDAKEAKSKALPPGTWSVFPVKCGGIDVFLR